MAASLHTKFPLLYFKATLNHKYAFSLAKLFYRIKYQPQHAFKVIWCRFINTVGFGGRNISQDLHLEHLNHFLKVLLKGLRSNRNEKNADRVSKSLYNLMQILKNVEKSNQRR